jgi:hypothetical protein
MDKKGKKIHVQKDSYDSQYLSSSEYRKSTIEDDDYTQDQIQSDAH